MHHLSLGAHQLAKETLEGAFNRADARVYPSCGVVMTNEPSRSRRGGLAAIVAALVLVALIPSQAAAATRPITFDLVLGYSCFWGRASDNATVNYTLRDSSGVLVIGGQTTSDESGYWSADCPTDGRSIRPGDRLRAADGNSVRKFVIPELTLILNRVTNVIRGRAPAGTQVEVEYLYPSIPVPDIVSTTKTINVGSDGVWSFRPKRDIIGGHGASLFWGSAAGHTIYLDAAAPMVVVTIGRATFSGIGRVLSQATVTLRDGLTSAVKGTGGTTVDGRGQFAGVLRSAGVRVPVQAGDRIISNVARDADFIVPDIEATGDPAAETVSGRCHDTGDYAGHAQVQVYRNGFQRGWTTFNTEPDGVFMVDVTDAFPNSSVIKHGDQLLVRCRQVTGDYVQKWFAVP